MSKDKRRKKNTSLRKELEEMVVPGLSEAIKDTGIEFYKILYGENDQQVVDRKTTEILGKENK